MGEILGNRDKNGRRSGMTINFVEKTWRNDFDKQNIKIIVHDLLDSFIRIYAIVGTMYIITSWEKNLHF